jgi:hypothetical protein
MDDEAIKILIIKIKGAFYGSIKLDLENLVGATIPTRKTLWNLNQYSVCSSDEKNKYFIGLNVS